jgi:hypothetical protein
MHHSQTQLLICRCRRPTSGMLGHRHHPHAPADGGRRSEQPDLRRGGRRVPGDLRADAGSHACQRQALAHLRRPPSLTSAGYSALTGVSKRTAVQDLRRLVDAGLLVW